MEARLEWACVVVSAVGTKSPSLCYGTTLHQDVPSTALCSLQAIHVQIK